MKKSLYLTVFSTLLSFVNYAQSWQWILSETGLDNDQGQSICTDADGNVMVTGIFAGTIFTIGNIELTNANPNGSHDIFVAKYDSLGTVLWAHSAGSTLNDTSGEITTDFDGNVLITGSFESDSITFGTITLFNNNTDGTQDFYVVKYDPMGNVLWAYNWGGTSHDTGSGIVSDTEGNVYICGYFRSTTMQFGDITVTNSDAPHRDIYLVKLDSNGTVVWAKSEGAIFDDIATSLAIDGNGNLILTGYFYNLNITFGTTTLNNNGLASDDIFVVKYDSDGTVVWAKNNGGSDDDYASNIAVDADENIFVTGRFTSSTLTIGGITLNNSGGGSDMLLVKYDPNGNVIWAKGMGGDHIDQGLDLAVDSNGYIIVTGDFRSETIPFAGNLLTHSGSSSNTDLFIAAYKADGTEHWAITHGSTGFEWARGVAVDSTNNILVTGYFTSQTIDFDTTSLTNVGGRDLFVGRMNPIEELIDAASASVAPEVLGCGTSNILHTFTNNGSTDINSLTIAWEVNGIIQPPYSWSGTVTPGATSSQITIGSYPFLSESEYLIKSWGELPNGVPDFAFNNDTTSTQFDLFVGLDLGADTSACQGSMITLSPNQTYPTYLWSTTETTFSIDASTSDSYVLQVIDDNGCAASDTIDVVIHPLPAQPTISASGNFLTASYTNNVQWYYEGSPISGEVNQIHEALLTGNYSVSYTDANGCVSISDAWYVDNTISIEENEVFSELNVFPNPAMDFATLKFGRYTSGKIDVLILNQLGQIVDSLSTEMEINGTLTLDINALINGVYFVRAHMNGATATFRLIKSDF